MGRSSGVFPLCHDEVVFHLGTSLGPLSMFKLKWRCWHQKCSPGMVQWQALKGSLFLQKTTAHMLKLSSLHSSLQSLLNCLVHLFFMWQVWCVAVRQLECWFWSSKQREFPAFAIRNKPTVVLVRSEIKIELQFRNWIRYTINDKHYIQYTITTSCGPSCGPSCIVFRLARFLPAAL